MSISQTTKQRLGSEFFAILKEPVPNVMVKPEQDNILVWHYLIFGPEGSPYEGGIYHGVLKFPLDFPFKPPSVYMYTPNGRFKTDSRICLSLSDFHSATWNPQYTVASILRELVILMVDDEMKVNCLRTDNQTKQQLAKQSILFNRGDKTLLELFPEYDQIINAKTFKDEETQCTTTEHTHSELSVPVISITNTNLPNDSNNNLTGSTTISISTSSASIQSEEMSTLSHSSTTVVLEEDEETRELRRQMSEFDSLQGRKFIIEEVNKQLTKEIATFTNCQEKNVVLPKIQILNFFITQEDKDEGFELSSGEETESNNTLSSSPNVKSSPVKRSPSPVNLSPPSQSKTNPKRNTLGSSLEKSAEIRTELRCRLSINFSNWHFLQQSQIGGNSEEQREKARVLVVRVFDKIMQIGYNNWKIRFVFSEVNLSETLASMRAIFNGTNGRGQTVHREAEVEVLNLSKTQTSARSLLSLHRMSNLRVLYLDHCPSLKKSGKDVFSLLSRKSQIPNLEVLSVVGTSEVLSLNWFIEVESSCPKLNTIYFTRKKGTKALGWQDLVLMQTMRNPHLLPCGHIADKAPILEQKMCSLDRVPVGEKQLIEINPSITKLSKDSEGKWSAVVVDFLREPLDGKCLLHPTCGEFYNLSSLITLFELSKTKYTVIDDKLIEILKTKMCPNCKHKLHNLRVCYPHSAEPIEKTTFQNLKDLSLYSEDSTTN